MEIIACYNVWNEEDTIAISMRSIQNLVDGYRVVDGRFEGYAEGYPVASVDRTVEIAKRFPNTEVIVLDKVLPQCEKHELVIDVCAKWRVLMDGHAIMYGDINRLRHELGYNKGVLSFDVPVYASFRELLQSNPVYKSHIIHIDSGAYYGGHHWMLKDKYHNIMHGRGYRADYVKLLWLHELRCLERKKMKDGFLLWCSRNPDKRW